MPTIAITVDDAMVLDVMRRLTASVTDLRPFFLEIGHELVQSTQQRFDTETAPDGSPWQQLSWRYRLSKRKRESRGADQILTRDGDMRRELHIGEATSDHLIFGSGRDYAATHQFGHDRIPARPFLGISDADRDTILTTALEYIQDALRP